MNMNDSFEDYLRIMWDEFLSESSENLAGILKGCYPRRLENDTLTIAAPNKFVKDFIKKPDRLEEITSALRTCFNNNSINAEIVVESDNRQTFNKNGEVREQTLQTAEPAAGSIASEAFGNDLFNKGGDNQSKLSEESTTDKYGKADINSNIQPELTFENFVCSTNNSVARETALVVAKSPGKVYNPLYLYSGVGLGKTHLMNAIANYIMVNNPNLKIIYISAEQFTNEFIESIHASARQASTAKAFRDKFRNADILLIDDIHFIIGKEGVQEELFQTMNTLQTTKRQIVISSDRPPLQMKNVIDRLKTRFGASMVADIQPPDLETRIAILRQKTNKMDVEIKDEVLNYIASEFHSNIRELEGALTRTIAYCRIHKIELSIENAKKALQDLLDNSKNIKIDADKITKTVCEYFHITENDLMGPKRDQTIARARQIAMYLCREMLPEMPYAQIGKYFGDRDHSTAMHSCRKVEQNINTTHYKVSINNIKQMLK